MNRKTAAVLLFAAAFAGTAIAGSKEDDWLTNRWRTKTAESAEARWYWQTAMALARMGGQPADVLFHVSIRYRQ